MALSGPCCLGLIVPTDVDNHNRRRAGEPQSSKERAREEEPPGPLLLSLVRVFHGSSVWWGGYEERVFVVLTCDLRNIFKIVVSHLA